VPEAETVPSALLPVMMSWRVPPSFATALPCSSSAMFGLLMGHVASRVPPPPVGP
jgi:hypothetical protein